jgi:hypothetical protein
LFNRAAKTVGELIDLLSPAEAIQAIAAGTETYHPNTSFIMMAIDKGKPALEDVKNGIKDVFKEFGIAAITSDDIEHESGITDRVLEEIEVSEFLIADLTGERPNVYYEVGNAHARGKRVILYHQAGTNFILMSPIAIALHTTMLPTLSKNFVNGWRRSPTDRIKPRRECHLLLPPHRVSRLFELRSNPLPRYLFRSISARRQISPPCVRPRSE